MRIAMRTRCGLPTALLMGGMLTAILAACGGYGGGSNYGVGGGGAACGGGYGSVCPAPTINLTAPAEPVGGTVALSATASASAAYNLTVTRVDFMVDAAIVGTATTSPYSVMWNSTTVANGSHSLTAKVTDSVNGTATAPPIDINVQNMAAAAAVMVPAQLFPAPPSTASGIAHVNVQLETGAARGAVQLTGLTATAVTINEALAGAAGPVVIRLTASGAEASEWNVPTGALLTAGQVTALLQGKLYVIATSAAYPRGEIRGQITPDNVVATFSALAPAAGAQALSPAAAGVVAATVDRKAHTLSVHVNSTGVAEADAAELDDAATGRRLVALTKDSVDMGHWSAELVPISASDVGAFVAGRWYVSIATPADTSGALRGQISAPRN